MELAESVSDEKRLGEVLQKLRMVFDKSEGLIDYPATQFVNMALQLGEFLPNNTEFDELFESMLPFMP